MTTALEVRCPSRLHAVIVDDLLQVKCRNPHCSGRKGVVVFHYYDTNTWDLVKTEKFADPAVLFNKRNQEVASGNPR